MSHFIHWLLIFAWLLLDGLAVGNKYTKEVNAGGDLEFDKQESPFRMQKVNLLWAKGKKKLTGNKLADLYADLKIHDKHEAQLKKMRADDMDKDGAMEAKVLTSYKRIVDRYGLDEYSPHDNGHTGNEIPQDENDKEEVHFQDPKLQTMWKRAKEAGFTEEDLELLKQEFWHQQMKINELDFIHRETDVFGDPADNSVDAEQQKLHLTVSEASERKAALKSKKTEIKEGYLRLEELASSLPSSEPTFKDSRVHKLWALAQKTNWTEEELNGFKEELKHFEHRLNKQNYYQEQLEDDRLAGDPDQLEHFESKHKILNQRITKLHKDFKTRLDKALRHSEL